MVQEPMTPELISMVSGLGTPAAALLATAYLAKELRAITARMLEVLTTTIDRNTACMAEVKSVLESCRRHGGAHK